MIAPTPPTSLNRRSKALWREIFDEFDLSMGELRLLENALLALERADAAAELVNSEGIVTLDRFGQQHAHPALEIEARNRSLYARWLNQLGVKAPTAAPRRTTGAKPGPRARNATLRRIS